ncbi:hypothetical protein [cf. Phormidesmis sp. LEGE 11477]|uniref:hypothetical protein n=1 Tax=cf. Phormidesmis sp. LEGE 11477 TaxID=1828680 RepID=UPI001880FE86|nr:hypothetical protein [cf. Phormidesmis sp. LEGE 11477]MBE9063239.1 hypothetical protein [cf. Phormidesmis sp. LEGE 11477]
MTSDASKKVGRNKKVSASQEFYVRTIAAWLLLLVPGLLIAFVSGRWLLFLLIGPAIASPLTICVYDLFQFLKKPGNKTKKLIVFALLGLGLALLLSFVGTQIYSRQPVIYRRNSLPEREQSTNGKTSDSTNLPLVQPLAQPNSQSVSLVQPPQPVAAFDQATYLGLQAAEIVQNPPHPISVWQSAYQRWEQAIQYLDSISSDTEVYAEAQMKLADYQANQAVIGQRIELEKSAAASYETASSLIDELVEMTESIEYVRPQDLPMLSQISAKLEAAIEEFETIPTGTALSASAQKQLEFHRKVRQGLQSTIETLETCDIGGIADCILYEAVEIAKLNQ